MNIIKKIMMLKNINIIDIILPPRKLELSDGQIVEEKRSRAPLIIALIILASILSINITGFDLVLLCSRIGQFFSIFGQMFPPTLSYLPKVWEPLFDTIKMSLIGSFIGSVLAIPFAIVASSNMIHNKAVVGIVRVFLSVVRTIPTLVVALAATYVWGLGTLAGTVAIAVFTFAYVAKQLFEMIETIDMGPVEAMEAMGSSKLKTFNCAAWPQVVVEYISVCLFCFEGNVRYAAILGYVGAGGLGLIISEKISWREYGSVGMILIVLFLTVVVIEGLSHFIRTKLS